MVTINCDFNVRINIFVILLLVALYFLFRSVCGQDSEESLSNRYLKVNANRETFLHQKDIFTRNEIISFKGHHQHFDSSDGTRSGSSFCRVQVLEDPVTQLAGKLDPQVFNCNFRRGGVKYVNFGPRLVSRDQVLLRVCSFRREEGNVLRATCKRLSLYIEITANSNYSVIASNFFRIKSGLRVKESFGASNPINKSVVTLGLNFNHSPAVKENRKQSTSCFVRLDRVDSSPFGKLIAPETQLGISSNVSRKKSLVSCHDFIRTGYRYIHMKGNISRDFITIGVEVKDQFLNEGEPIREWLQIPVTVENGKANDAPLLLSSAERILLKDGSLFTLSSHVLSASDDSTEAKRIIFNVTSLECNCSSSGFFVHVSDTSEPIDSFLQMDVEEKLISFHPPVVSNEEHLVRCLITIKAFDDFMASSEPALLDVSVTYYDHNLEPIEVMERLTVIEGFSVKVTTKDIRVANDSDDGQVISIIGGLLHGQLLVSGSNSSSSFSFNELRTGLVVYSHDGSDTSYDYLQFSSGAILPVHVIPVDNKAPLLLKPLKQLVINRAESQWLPITRLNLEALDVNSLSSIDSPVIYSVKEPPVHGILTKRYHWQRKGHPTYLFTQEDINRDIIYYKLIDGAKKLKEEFKEKDAVEDGFTVILRDINYNESPKQYKVTISITDQRKPEPGSISHRLVVEETNIAVITTKSLHYFDGGESGDDEIVYEVTEKPKTAIDSTSDSGRIVFLPKFESKTRREGQLYPETDMFSQKQLLHGMVGYVPPNEDIGAYPLPVIVVFTVRNRHGIEVPNQFLNITVLPVNNQAPQLITGQLEVEEGSSVLLSTNDLWIYDEDTTQANLQIALFTVPLHGNIKRNGHLLRVGDRISIEDILSLRLEYTQDGSEFEEDSITIGANDGVHFISGTIRIKIILIDDKTPIWGLPQNVILDVYENTSICISSDALHARDPDTDDDAIYFIITEAPSLGYITVGNKSVATISQKDIINNNTRYVHRPNEIGILPIVDNLTLIASDRIFPRHQHYKPLTLSIRLLPVNSQPPTISVKAVLVVGEGQEAELKTDVLTAHDPDTVPDDLFFHLTTVPSIGILMMDGQQLDVQGIFSWVDLSQGNVKYIQSNHTDFEPESDSFKLKVSDGIFNSTEAVIPIIIILTNEEIPQVFATNFLVLSGESLLLDDNVLQVQDKDYPGDIILVSMARPPLSGHLVAKLTSEANVSFPFTQLPLDRFQETVYYQHDGSTHSQDRFDLEISDGAHFESVTLFVQIYPGNETDLEDYYNLDHNLGDDREGNISIGKNEEANATTIKGVDYEIVDYQVFFNETPAAQVNSSTENSLRAIFSSGEALPVVPIEEDDEEEAYGGEPVLTSASPVNSTLTSVSSTWTPFEEEKRPRRQRKCPRGWHFFPENLSCYRWFRARVSWKMAKQRCDKNFGATLPLILSQSHNHWLLNLAKRKPFWNALNARLMRKNKNGYPWDQWHYRRNAGHHSGGMRGANKPGNMPFTNWQPSYPRVNRFGTIAAKCALVVGPDGGWINRHCTKNYQSYICQSQASL